MELEHEFTVPVPVRDAWPVLLDVERVAPCMPGATLDAIDGDEFTGRLKVKVGPVTVTYRGKAGFTHKDEQTHTVTIEGSGKEARGSGTASATVRAQLHDEGESTRVTVHTELQVTGRPAQFGRNVMSEVGGKLIGKFAECLAGQLAGPQAEEAATPAAAPAAGEGGVTPSPAPAPTTSGPSTQASAPTSPNGSSGEQTADGQEGAGARGESAPRTRPAPAPPPSGDADALNLFDVAGGPMLKRALPALGALLAIFGIVRLVRRKRGH